MSIMEVRLGYLRHILPFVMTTGSADFYFMGPLSQREGSWQEWNTKHPLLLHREFLHLVRCQVRHGNVFLAQPSSSSSEPMPFVACQRRRAFRDRSNPSSRESRCSMLWYRQLRNPHCWARDIVKYIAKMRTHFQFLLMQLFVLRDIARKTSRLRYLVVSQCP